MAKKNESLSSEEKAKDKKSNSKKVTLRVIDFKVFGSYNTGEVKFTREGKKVDVYAAKRAKPQIVEVENVLLKAANLGKADGLRVMCYAQGWRHIGVAGQMKEMINKYEEYDLIEVVSDQYIPGDGINVPDEYQFVIKAAGTD